jgi:hypothetical protein
LQILTEYMLSKKTLVALIRYKCYTQMFMIINKFN